MPQMNALNLFNIYPISSTILISHIFFPLHSLSTMTMKLVLNGLKRKQPKAYIISRCVKTLPVNNSYSNYVKYNMSVEDIPLVISSLKKIRKNLTTSPHGIEFKVLITNGFTSVHTARLSHSQYT